MSEHKKTYYAELPSRALSQTRISYALLFNGSFKGLSSDYSGFSYQHADDGCYRADLQPLFKDGVDLIVIYSLT